MPGPLKSVTRGLLLSALISASAALPASTTSLSSADPAGTGTFLWISKVAPTVFGQDATSFDYYLFSEPTLAKEAMHDYARAAAGGSEEHMVTAFLNATLAGTMTHEQASSTAWKCAELGEAAASHVASCQDLARPAARGVYERDLSARSRYKWITSKSHVSSSAAVDALAGALGRNPTFEFPSSPRSFCITSGGTMGCISWSNTQTFTHGTAEGYISDAQSVVEFNTFSAQANGILGAGAKADVCISNRGTGCT